jgi:hypothetical protein
MLDFAPGDDHNNMLAAFKWKEAVMECSHNYKRLLNQYWV